MANIRFNKITLALSTVVLATSFMSGCTTVRNYWQEYTGLDKSGREPTGYYEHLENKVYRNTLVVPEELNNIGQNRELQLPNIDPNTLVGPLGADVDVRSPIAPLRSDIGLSTQWADGEALVWFDPRGQHQIQTEDDAWMLLDKVLKHMQVGIGKVLQGQYVLTTISRDFNEYGQPYTLEDEERGIIRYNQIYQLRVGRGNDGNLGIATKLLASYSSLSNGHSIEDQVEPIAAQRFSMGFANNIIHELENKDAIDSYDPDVLVVMLDQDKNKHLAIMVEAPFSTTFALLSDILPHYGFTITKTSVSNAEFEVEFIEGSDGYYERRHVDPFNFASGKYKIRVGLEGNRSSITFYDSNDAPLWDEVQDLYPGFSQALINEYQGFGGPAQTVSAD